MKTFAVRSALACCVMFSVAGCSSIAVTEKDADSVPPSRIYADAMAGPAKAAGDGTILFLRDWGFGGGGCEHDVYLDATKVFGIRVNEQISIHAPSGPHSIRIENTSVICPTVIASQQTVLEAGSTQVYRIQLPGTGGLSLARLR